MSGTEPTKAHQRTLRERIRKYATWTGLGVIIAALSFVYTVWKDQGGLSSPLSQTSQAPSSPLDSHMSETSPSPSETGEPESPSPSETNNSNQEISEARIEVDEDYFIKPNIVSSGQSPGFEPFIFTEAGRLSYSDPCYVSWKIYNNSKLEAQEDTRCEKDGFASSFWPLDIELKPGTIKVLAEVTTEWGATKTAEVNLKVQ